MTAAPGDPLASLVERMLGGDRVALARLMTLVENRAEGVVPLLGQLYARTGRAHRIGITGPPGAGKSTLTSRLVSLAREAGRRVGVLAVDPSSPFSGGAVLGDRIRMQQHFLDPGVFIRSLSTRGQHGGIPAATRDLARLLDAYGCEDILVETVGVGQTELDVMRLAETVVVVLVPEAGDAVQVMKAGILEIADVFVVNKADREGADRMRGELLQMLQMRGAQTWEIPVVLTSANTGDGIAEVAEAIARHRRAVGAAPDRAERAREARLREVRDIVTEELGRRAERALARGVPQFANLLADIAAGTLDPYTGALRIIEDVANLSILLGER